MVLQDPVGTGLTRLQGRRCQSRVNSGLVSESCHCGGLPCTRSPKYAGWDWIQDPKAASVIFRVRVPILGLVREPELL